MFNDEQEKILVETFFEHENELAGLTSHEVRRVAFNMAKKHNLPNNFNEVEGLAGEDWFQGFEQRHPEVTLRKPGAYLCS